MTQPIIIEPFTDIPEDVGAEIKHLMTLPAEPSIGAWLLDLIRASGHMSTGDDMRWRLLSLLWLAAEYDIEAAWPYLMWLNQKGRVMSDHLTEILTEALDDYNAHLRLARWMASPGDDRLAAFLSEFQNLPVSYKMAETFAHLIHVQSNAPEIDPWLANFCRHTVDQVSPYVRPWHLLAATWYATCYNPSVGLTYLQKFSDDRQSLSEAAHTTLMNLAEQLYAAPAITHWIATCQDTAVKSMLQEFGHPDLATFTEAIFQTEPDYSHLSGFVGKSSGHAAIFQRNERLFAEVGITKASQILDIACGPLAAQTLLLHSAGYQITGADLHIPPAYLPPPGIRQRLKRGKYVKAWEAATQRYYTALAGETGLNLNWRKLKIHLADIMRLSFESNCFDVVLCSQYLHQAPNVNGLLSEAARILKPGGLLVIDIQPYASLQGAFTPTTTIAWAHLQPGVPEKSTASLTLNKWREAAFRTAIEQYFDITQWLTEQDETAVAKLTPELRIALADYSDDELTRKEIVVVAKKRG